MTPHAYARRHGTLHNRLRSATEQFDFAQAREYQALREETLVLVLAGQLTDSGVGLSEFADLAATSRIVRQAVDMATRWRSIPISIGRTDAAGSAGLHQATELGASLSEIGRLAPVPAGVAGASPLPPTRDASADLFQIGPRSAADADDTPNASQQSCASSAPFRRRLA